jgi:hypothetical protein
MTPLRPSNYFPFSIRLIMEFTTSLTNNGRHNGSEETRAFSSSDVALKSPKAPSGETRTKDTDVNLKTKTPCLKPVSSSSSELTVQRTSPAGILPPIPGSNCKPLNGSESGKFPLSTDTKSSYVR